MKLRSLLAGTALAAIALVAAPQTGITGVTTRAEAAVDINVGIFYDQLGQYGDWVTYDDEYVFIPGRVDAGWRPYTEGHWVYTRRYGWTWVSDEPFGWATYHYGRWGYSEDIGWYWVPGRRWAPAWVSWRRSNDYVVWAPLPPSRHGGGIDVSIDITVGDIPDYYWVAVPTRRFLAPDIQVVVVNDDREIRNVVQHTEYVGTPRITNNIVVNNVIDVNVISRETGHKVEAVEVKTTNNPTEARATAHEVTAFQGEIAADTKVKPKKLVDMSEVKKVKRTRGSASQDASTPPDASTTGGTATGTAPTTTGAAQTETSTTRKKKTSDSATTTAPAGAASGQTAPETGQAPATQAQDQLPGKKKKKPNQNQNAAAPADGQQPGVQAQDQPAGKKKKKQQQGGNASTPASGGQTSTQARDQQGQQGKKKRKQQGGDDATGSTSPAPAPGNAAGNNAPDQNATAPADQKRKGKGKKDLACDPANDPNCAAQ
jgi:hypothetical protein